MAELLADGADVNATVANGKTALYIACNNGHTEVVTRLPLRRRRGEGRNDGVTPHSRRCRGRTEIVQVLLAANASVDIQERWRHAAGHGLPEGHAEIVAKRAQST